MNYELALGVLSKWKVELVLVEGAAVVAHGSTLTTQDLDIVYRVEPENIKRLLGALQDLQATAYGDPRGLSFDIEHLNNHGHHLNNTLAGRIDVLGFHRQRRGSPLRASRRGRSHPGRLWGKSEMHLT